MTVFAGELMLHYVKIKSISENVIQNVLIERQTLTTTEFLKQSKHAIIVVNEISKDKYELDFVN